MTFSGDQAPARLKRALRAAAVERRRKAHERGGTLAAERVRDKFLDRMAPPEGRVVAAYWPIGDELDVRPLMQALSAKGWRVALPVVTAPGQPLEFRIWASGDLLEGGPYGTRHPTAAAPAVVPDIVLVPLLAFDRRGHRLGYGGGYYDRTLAMLRAGKAVTAIGVAYAAQEVAAVPSDGHDQRLDVVLTEKDVMDLRGKQR